MKNAAACRSWLFVPASSPAKLAKARSVPADAIIVDLEDSVAAQDKAGARGQAALWLAGQEGSGFARYVRINAVTSPHWRDDLAAILPSRPDGIVLPKVARPDEVRAVADALDGLEAGLGLAHGRTGLVPMLGEGAAAALAIRGFAQAGLPRLLALTWGSEDLAADLRATRKRDEGGQWAGAFALVRQEVLLVARALGLAAIETIEPDFRDLDRFQGIARAAAADGFEAMLAIHPAQVEGINAAFQPDEGQVARARAILAAFAAQPEAAAISFEGRMLERLHRDQARALLDRAGKPPAA